MQENIELDIRDKQAFKILSAQRNVFMRDLIVREAREILSEGLPIPTVERKDNRTSLIINISTSLKDEVKDYCEMEDVRIRDFWVECIRRSIERYSDESI